ncbi:hypothetical protein J7E83_02580 [Arthrobacter sp. ISL-48]|uniref:beta strand repeat-containing protein n=1 Tax=Arthrobacter sp. ISL-48 TaxID=2819110 RepID=UPI001BE76C75|nr:hypothetical protein [Arthrobacter sp. ISL-48]MBT2531025.1 hypothetical protein [Arthrobacter sp. ISL-48]
MEPAEVAGGLERAQRAVVVIILALAALLAPGAGPAFSYSTGPGSGTGSSSMGTLQPPTNVIVPATSTGTVHLSWTAATGTPKPTGYYVTRTLTGNGSTGAACGTSKTATTTALSCDDLTVPVGTYRYSVTSVYRTWTAPSALSTSVGVTPPGTPTKLVFITQPSNSTSGVALPTQPAVAVTDVNGSIVTTQAPTQVTLSISGGTLSGCLSAATVNGVASFSGCNVSGAGSYTLTATSAPLTSAISAPFTVAGPAAQLAFTTNPTSSSGGTAFETQPVLAVQDSSGRTVTTSTSAVTLSITGSPAGSALACTTNPVTAASGIAAFTGCSVNKAGTYTLTATGAGFTTVSTSVTIATGPATRLAFTTQPSGSTGSAPFATQPAVSIQDDGGNTVTTSSATVNLTLTGSSGAFLSCTASAVVAVNGVAAFNGCSIDKTGTYTLTATSTGLIYTLSNTTVIAAGAATKLGFTTQPSASSGGVAFFTQPVVAIQDAGGNTTASTAPVTLSITGSPAGAVLSCAANPVTAAGGISAFSGCSINKAGTYTLTASGAGFTATSVNFTVSLGTATKLCFTTQPTSSTGGIAFSSQPVVAVQDAGGNTITTSSAPVTLSITTPGGAALTCTTNPVTAISGVSAFSGCSINRPGTYTLTAASGSLTNAVSTSITVTIGPAAKLGFTTSPTDTQVNTVLAVQPVVAVQDAGGNTITTSTAPITLKITAPSGGANLTCTTNPKSASSGIASFPGCKISKTGTRTLTATSGTLAAGVSSSFNITGGTATKLAFTTSPTDSTGGMAFPTQPVVAVQDVNGNTTSSTASVTLTITTPAGAALSCTANPKPAVAGVATFAGCNINKTGTYTLTATSGSLTATASTSFTITVGPAAKPVFTTSPSNTTYSTVFATQPVVAVQDAGGNTTTSTAPVTLSITNPAGAVLSCTINPVTAASGVAGFAGCSIDKPGTYTLTATSSGLSTGVSSTFTITAGPATKLTFTTSPSGSTGGIAFITQPVVTIQDAGGHTATSTNSVSLSITTPAGATLTCTTNPVTAVAGVASFGGCKIDKTGTYTLTATSGTLTAAASTSFTITVGPAAKLAFTTQPSGAAANSVFATQPVVAVQDLGGNTVTTSAAAVTLSITGSGGNANLTCTNTTTINAVSGVAAFTGCKIDKRGSYTLDATSSGLTAARSNLFTIS